MDVAIITVIEEEYLAVRRLIEHPTLASGRKDHPNGYSWEYGKISTPRYPSTPYVVVTASAGQAGSEKGLLATLETVERWDPRYVLIVGIAGGLPRENVQKGDVVVSNLIYGYEYGKLEAAFRPRNDHVYTVDGALVNAARTFAARDKSWCGLVDKQPPSSGTPPKVVVGLVASGEKVVDDVGNPLFRAVHDAWPDIQAIEMEGAGAAAAVKALQERGRAVGLAMVRGISDMPRREDAPAAAPETQKAERDAWKAYASATAAAFTIGLVRHAWPVPPRAHEQRPGGRSRAPNP